jgi:hypothetical protein
MRESTDKKSYFLNSQSHMGSIESKDNVNANEQLPLKSILKSPVRPQTTGGVRNKAMISKFMEEGKKIRYASATKRK